MPTIDPNESDPYESNRQAFESNENFNVFVIMRFGPPGSPLQAIEDAIKDTLAEYHLHAVLARDVALDPELWHNVRFCMDHCRYAIAVFERIRQPEFNPNVTLELGYMLANKRPCLVLKDESLPTMPSDIIGRLYWSFDTYNATESVRAAVQRWLEQLGHTRIRSAETITAQSNLEANKLRTRRILKAISQVHSGNEPPGMIRQAASLSSFAISDIEGHCDPEFHQLILQERDNLIQLLNEGWTLRTIICPESQIDWVELHMANKEYVTNNIIPRYEQLVAFIEENIDNPNLQIVYTLRLPHENLLIVRDTIVFIGRRRRREAGFPYTTVLFDQAVIEDEISEFDATFDDNAGAILEKECVFESDYASRRLKECVNKKLRNAKRRLKNLLRHMDTT